MNRAIAELLTRAQQSGAVRTDIDIDDLMRILKGAFIAAQATGANDDQRRRTFTVIFDGLRQQ
jgi:hypothetical protein